MHEASVTYMLPTYVVAIMQTHVLEEQTGAD